MGGPLRTRVRAVSGPPVAALRVWLTAGERHAVTPGEALLAGRMLEEGSRSRGWRQIARDAEERGVAIAAMAGYEVLALALDGPAEEVERMIEWGAELTLEAAFPRPRWEWQRRLAGAELELLRDDPEAVAGWGFLNQLYGAHPRGRPLQGDPASLERLGVGASRAAWERALASGVIVALAGAVDEVRCGETIRETFRMRAGGEPRLVAPSAPSGGERRREVTLPGDQAHLFLGRTTVARDSADLSGLELLSVILGAGAGVAGRLPARVRERDGLAYTAQVDTAAGASADPGRLAIHVATAPETLRRAESAVREELSRLLDGGVSPDELAMAKSFLLGQEAFRRETARQVADLMAEAELTGQPVDSPRWGERRWTSWTEGRLRAVAERWLDPADLWVTLGRPALSRRRSGAA